MTDDEPDYPRALTAMIASSAQRPESAFRAAPGPESNHSL
jgi:hypothetical protein